MSKSMKAALLSALVFPGAGHLYLNKRIIGALLAGASFVALYLIVSNMIERAMQITEKIQRGEVDLDVAAISELLSRQPAGNGSQLLDVAWFVLIACWLVALVDAYRRGRTQDESDINR